MSRNISIKIENLKTIISGNPVVVCNNSDYVITFAFDEDWVAYDVKTARFVYTRGGHIQSQDVVFTGNICPVPVFYDITDVLIGVFTGDIHTTTPAKIYCMKSILDYHGHPEEPAPDVYAQILELINSGRLQGPAGEAGATYTPVVSDDGELSWTNDRGLNNPEPVNIRGPQGKEGATGPQGPPGDNTAALEAAKIATDAAANANAAADAARELIPEIEQLKSNVVAITPDDAAVNGKPWTSKQIVDSLCQPFEETGNPVQCYPVESYPLGVTVRIEPIQEGSGDPSPENVRPIIGQNAVSVTRCGKNLLNIADVCDFSRWRPDIATDGSHPTSEHNKGYVLPVSHGTQYTIIFDFGEIIQLICIWSRVWAA